MLFPLIQCEIDVDVCALWDVVFYLNRQVSKEQSLIYNDDTGPRPITAGCEAPWIQTRHCSEASVLRCSVVNPCATREPNHTVCVS